MLVIAKLRMRKRKHVHWMNHTELYYNAYTLIQSFFVYSTLKVTYGNQQILYWGVISRNIGLQSSKLEHY